MLTVLPPTKAKTMHGKTEEKTMMWVDYAIDQAGPNFTVKGDWPGDVFVVNESGWLIKQNVDD